MDLHSGEEWKGYRGQLNQMFLETVLRSAFGADLQIPDEQMKEFSRIVFDVVSVFGLNLLARNMGHYGGVFFSCMAGSKATTMPLMKDTARQWVEKYRSEGLSGAGQVEWFVDTLLDACESGKSTLDEAVSDVALLFSAGSHTLAGVSEQCLLFAAMHPEYQERVRKELRSVFDDRSQISLKRLNAETPCLKAFTRECLRLSPTLITALPRFNNQSDLEIEGYCIPKGATIWINMLELHSNAQIWGEQARSFNMDRWLDEHGNFNSKLVPFLHAFGHGTRNCPGRQLGLNQLQLCMAHLLFDWQFSFLGDTVPDRLKFLDFAPYESGFSLKVTRV